MFTGDHALIDITQLLSLNPRQVTVRTKSRDNQSTDSNPVLIPGAKNKSPHHHHHHHHKVKKKNIYRYILNELKQYVGFKCGAGTTCFYYLWPN